MIYQLVFQNFRLCPFHFWRNLRSGAWSAAALSRATTDTLAMWNGTKLTRLQNLHFQFFRFLLFLFSTFICAINLFLWKMLIGVPRPASHGEVWRSQATSGKIAKRNPSIDIFPWLFRVFLGPSNLHLFSMFHAKQLIGLSPNGCPRPTFALCRRHRALQSWSSSSKTNWSCQSWAALFPGGILLAE